MKSLPRTVLLLAVLAMSGCNGSQQGEAPGGGPASWAKAIEIQGAARGLQVAACDDGSCVLGGQFHGSFSIGAEVLRARGEGTVRDVFVARFAPDGTPSWARAGGGKFDDEFAGVATWPDGSCIVAGSFTGDIAFGGTTLSARGDSDVFLACYARDGTLKWARSDGGDGSDAARAVIALRGGSCVLAADFKGSTVFGVGDPGERQLSPSGPGGLVLARYSANGQVEWVKSIAGTSGGQIGAMSAAPDGAFMATGTFFGTIRVGGPNANPTTLSASELGSLFLARFSSEGSVTWARRTGGEGAPTAAGVSFLDDGSCVVAGEFYGELSFGPGELDGTKLNSGVAAPAAFVARFDKDGRFRWATKAGGSQGAGARAVAGLPGGDCVVTGRYHGEAQFGESSLTERGDGDVFVMRCDVNGGVSWLRSAGGVARDDGVSVSSSGGGTFVLAGQFGKECSFGKATLTSRGSEAVFLCRFGVDGELH